MTMLQVAEPITFANGWMPARPAYRRRVLEFPFGKADVYVGADAAREALPWFRASTGLAVDIETLGFGTKRWWIKAIAIAVPSPDGIVVAVLDPRTPNDETLARDILRGDAKQSLIFHNAMFDVPTLTQKGFLEPSDVWRVWDTVLATRMANAGEDAGLEAAGERYLGMKSHKPWKDIGPRWSSDSWYADGDLYRKSYLDGIAADAAVTLALVHPVIQASQERLLSAQGLPFALTTREQTQALLHREMTVLRTCLYRSTVGMPVHLDVLDRFRTNFLPQLDDVIAKLAIEGISPSNSNHMSAYLARRDIFSFDPKWPRNAKGGPAAQKAWLKKLVDSDPVVAYYLNARAMQKVAGYLETIRESHEATGYVHHTVNLLQARTGRMSVSDPALQQFPAPARGIIASPFPEGLASTDWTAVEVFLAGAIAQDRTLLHELCVVRQDPYDLIRKAANIDRPTAKIVVLAGIYGQGIASLANALRISEDEARVIRDKSFSVMPEVTRYMRTSMYSAEGLGHVVTMSGRVLPIGRDKNTGQLFAYKATNYAVQGSGYDLMSEAIFQLHEQGYAEQILMPIHDELVTSADPEVTHAVAAAMRRIPPALEEHLNGIPFQLFAEPEPTGDRWTKPDKSDEVKLYEIPGFDDDDDEEEVD